MSPVEEWRTVAVAPDYEVSNLGRVRRGDRILACGPHRRGYRNACLRRNGRNVYRTVHSLVADAFMGPRPPGKQIDHKNGDKTDNRTDNLEWVTPRENTRRAIASGLSPNVSREVAP